MSELKEHSAFHELNEHTEHHDHVERKDRPEGPGHEAHGPHNDHGPRGDHGPHRNHGPRGDHGPHNDHGPRGDHGAHRNHGPHGDHGPHDGPEDEGGTRWRALQYDSADVNGKIIINLRDLSHMMRSLYEGRGSQKRVLIILDAQESTITQRELTERLGIRPGSASEVIAKLEHAGYLQRVPSEQDRRTADLVLTDAGRAVAAEAKSHRSQRHAEMFACLTDKEKAQLQALLEKVSQDWEDRYRSVRRERRSKAPGCDGDCRSCTEKYCRKGE